MRSRWKALLRCFDDGRLALDNNPAERALRCVAIGRKNYLFAGSDAGGRRAAALYSLIETAKLNRRNPQHYLADVLARIADHPARQIADLLPWHWNPQSRTAPPRDPASSPSGYACFADAAYRGPKLDTALDKIGRWTLEIIQRSDAATGFVLLPRRWVIERPFAWLNRDRRLAKDFEATPESARAWLFLASVKLLSDASAEYHSHRS